jgi:hypothetical protein
MLASALESRLARRGIVLVLVLGMLGLMALIGVTFATFSGQAQVNARNFSQSQYQLDATHVMDFALSQLIDDTANPLSAIRGHSLKRDMYGNDAANNGALLNGNPGTGATLFITAATQLTTSGTPFDGLWQCTTNISLNDPSFYGYNFTRWIVRCLPQLVTATVPQTYLVGTTYEVIADDALNNVSQTGFRVLYLAAPSTIAVSNDPLDSTSYSSPETNGATQSQTQPLTLLTSGTLAQIPFTLDGRYLRAFNGPGLASLSHIDANNGNIFIDATRYPNFRLNGNIISPGGNSALTTGTATTPMTGEPNAVGMDEDYDACDLENWFLAIQSADGSVIVPSFHRPGIIVNDANVNDWRSTAPLSAAKFLRPRGVDHNNNFMTFPDLVPNAAGRIAYDVDNDGDGNTDSVWLDLGYPAVHDPSGQMYKPLFAFLVLGLNGRMPLNTVGNLQARDGNGTPQFTHTSHLGNSPSEIDPRFALQNAADPGGIAGTNGGSPPFTNTQYDNAYLGYIAGGTMWPVTPGTPIIVPGTPPIQPASLITSGSPNNGIPPATSGLTAVTTAGFSVADTQLRNLLAGTRPPVNPFVADTNTNADINFIYVNGRQIYLPNGFYDYGDGGGTATISRLTNPVAGRWGESGYVPSVLPQPYNDTGSTAGPGTNLLINFLYNNPVRAGQSLAYPDLVNQPGQPTAPTTLPGGYIPNPPFLWRDADDDNFNTFDMWPNAVTAEVAGAYPADYYDAAGGLSLPVERIRRFVTPIDVSGDGLIVTPNSSNSAFGGDIWGRIEFFRYFRPPGVPVATQTLATPPTVVQNTAQPFIPISPIIAYTPPSGVATASPTLATTTAGSPAITLTSVTGSTYTPTTSTEVYDVTNNPYHGYDMFRSPRYDRTNPGTGNQPFMTAGMPYNSNGLDSNNNPLPDPNYSGVAPGTASNIPTPPSNVPTFYTGFNPDLASGTSGSVLVGANSTMAFTPPDAVTPPSLVKFPSPNLNEADEMQLYQPNGSDAPFSFSDLEWLYRLQDTDGAALHSRLAQLAPVSFVYASDAMRRRRMFSVDTWETTNFVWANDNPQGAFINNSRFTQFASASMANLNVNSTTISNAFGSTALAAYGNYPWNLFANPLPTNSPPVNPPANTNIWPFPQPPLAGSSPDASAGWPAVTVPLAQRDRKINLNYPLPVSNNPQEPVRQKWILETYSLLKNILPPKSIDTPQELAQLSQFVVNIIDFRDPDCTMTMFQNPDVMEVPAQPGTINAAAGTFTGASPAYLIFSNATPPTGMTPVPLIQYGMEYNPVAINESMAYSFQINTGGTTGVQTNRFFLELVSTLTESNQGANSYLKSVLDVSNWDIVIAEDNPISRPDPFTGQIGSQLNLVTASTAFSGASGSQAYPPIQLSTLGTTPNLAVQTNPPAGTSATVPTPVALLPLRNRNGGPASSLAATGTQPAFNYYYVIGNTLANNVAAGKTVPAETNPPSINPGTVGAVPNNSYPPTNPIDLMNVINLAVDPFQMKPIAGYTTPAMLAPPAASAKYIWVYLRRPANPFAVTTDPSYSTTLTSTANTNPMVVVDCIRVPFIESGGTYNSGNDPQVKIGSNYIYSVQRMQPYRGGHAVPLIEPVGSGFTAPTGSSAIADPTYGYTEQIAGQQTGVSPVNLWQQKTPGTWGICLDNLGNSNQITGPAPAGTGFYNTLGSKNDSAEAWDYFPFNDRDFTSVAELLMVPGCPPGLFTKQFTEAVPLPIATAAGIQYSNFPATQALATPTAAALPTATQNPANPPTATASLPLNPTTAFTSTTVTAYPIPHTFPYLIDNFFYTASTEFTYPVNSSSGATQGLPPPYPTTVNTTTPPTTTLLPYVGGGPSGAGWHKMLDFFEVPSPAFGAIGPVAQGANFDWVRQDTRPGLLNLNLIIDEEVFLGLMGNTPITPLNFVQLTDIQTPAVVTQIDSTGAPSYAYNLQLSSGSVGGGYYDITYTNPVTTFYGSNFVKAAFSDFLKLRHGGSGYLFAYGLGTTGLAPVLPARPFTGATTQGGAIAHERPFHSLSYPDIDYTVMRPASLPPSTNTIPVINPVPPTNPFGTPPYWPTLTTAIWPYSATNGAAATNTGTGVADPNNPNLYFVGDPGVKNPYLAAMTSPYLPDPIPPRRLFQIPDFYGSVSGFTGIPSNAATAFNVTTTAPLTFAGDPNVNLQILSGYTASNPTGPGTLANNQADLTPIPAASAVNVYLGNSTGFSYTAGGNPFFAYDSRQHPYFRTEWLQKIMNLTTVRTHQYAVWITVGFFEVLKQGDPELAASHPVAAYDILGQEVGLLSGQNVRYRAFFILDRTRATGFNPNAPGDFHDVVVYRQRIQ